MSELDHLNDTATMPTPQLKSQNQQCWIDRYRTAPSITPGSMSPSGGTGFLDYKRVTDPNIRNQMLAGRAYERDHASNPQDRERLSLLYNAEKAHCQDSKANARKALGELIAYDKTHGHPAITDPSRDLSREPYTAQEQSNWHRRDGRQLTSQEVENARDLDWQNHKAYQIPDRQAPQSPEGKWYLHPANEPNRQNVVAQFKQQEHEAELVRQSRLQAPALDRSRIEQQRERTL